MIDANWLIIICPVCFALGFFISNGLINEEWQVTLIEKDLAQYNPVSGKWEWKEGNIK